MITDRDEEWLYKTYGYIISGKAVYLKEEIEPIGIDALKLMEAIEHPERLEERGKVYYELLNRKRMYVDNEINKLHNKNRRAREQGLPNTLTSCQQAKILTHFKGGCALTGDEGDIHMDHVIPISVGHAGTTYENIIPLRADLNLSKHNRNLFDWFADNRDRFGLEQQLFDELITYLAGINGMTNVEYETYVYECHKLEQQKGRSKTV